MKEREPVASVAVVRLPFAFDPDESALLVVLQQPDIAGTGVGGESAVGVPVHFLS